MAAETPVYFKIGYDEYLNGKKDILYSQVSLLSLLKIIKRYNAWRTGENDIRLLLYKSIKDLNLAMRKMKTSLPYLEMPEEKEEKESKKAPKIPVKKGEVVDDDLKSQLEDIQNKLNSLSQ